jgi:hypothetical protein
MALKIRFQYPTGSRLGYSIERLSDGSLYDFSAANFVATPTTLISPLPEDAGSFIGRYKTTLTPTPPQLFTDGDYVVTIHDEANASVVVAELAATIHAGDDATVIPAPSIDPWSITLPGTYAAGTAGNILGANLDAKVSSRSTFGGGAVASVTAPVTVGTVNDKAGYSLAASGLNQVVIESGIDARQALSAILSWAAGAIAGAGTGTLVVKGANTGATRIVETVDGAGNRSSVTLTLPAPAATGYTLSGPTVGITNTASTNFTVTPNGTYSGTVTILPSGGALSTPIVLTFNNSSTPQMFTITPTSIGAVTLTPTNSGGLTDPSGLSYVAAAPKATSYTLTGPSSGTTNASSSNFTVTPVGGVYTGSITITPSGGGLSTPIVMTFSNSSAPQTFTIAPISAGTVTLSPSNSGGLTDASNMSYTAVVAATTYSFSGPSSGTPGVASTSFTVVPNGVYSGTITVTPSGGGLSAPIVLTFSNSSAPQTFTIAPTSAGTVTLSPSNTGGLANPAGLTYTNISITTYLDDTFSGTAGSSIVGGAPNLVKNGSDVWGDINGFGAMGYAPGGGAIALGLGTVGVALATYSLTGTSIRQVVTFTFKSSTAKPQAVIILDRTTDGTNSLNIFADYSLQNIRVFQYISGQPTLLLTAPVTLVPGTPYSLVATVTETTLSLSLDGSSIVAGQPITLPLGTQLLIGQGGGTAGDVVISEVRVTSNG